MISKGSIKKLKKREDREKKIKKKKDEIKKEVFFAIYHKICPYCAGKIKYVSSWWYNRPRGICNNCEIRFETILGGMDFSLDCIYNYNDCKIIKIKGGGKK